eukprot:GHVR01008646.1.p1 GENE.GHVR01008646.1~~GHVR01008646.1.p1  ORF type:complete len:229 (+),score=5.52 GHVR01008646.1:29-715(+)
MAAKLAFLLVVVCVVIGIGNCLDYEFNVKSRGKETVDLDWKGRKIEISGKDSFYVKRFNSRWGVVKNTKTGECILKRSWSGRSYARYMKKTLAFLNNTSEDLIEKKTCTKVATRSLNKRWQKWADKYYKDVCSSLKAIRYRKGGRTASLRDLDTIDEEYELDERLMDELRDLQPEKKASSVTICRRTTCSSKKRTYKYCCKRVWGAGRGKCQKYCKKSKPACYTSYTI